MLWKNILVIISLLAIIFISCGDANYYPEEDEAKDARQVSTGKKVFQISVVSTFLLFPVVYINRKKLLETAKIRLLSLQN